MMALAHRCCCIHGAHGTRQGRRHVRYRRALQFAQHGRFASTASSWYARASRSLRCRSNLRWHANCCAGNITMGLCPPGTQATADMRFCEPCKGDDFNLVAGGVCRPCPMGAKCTAGDHLEALPDWWCVQMPDACWLFSHASVLRQACFKHFCHFVLLPVALFVSVGTGRR